MPDGPIDLLCRNEELLQATSPANTAEKNVEDLDLHVADTTSSASIFGGEEAGGRELEHHRGQCPW